MGGGGRTTYAEFDSVSRRRRVREMLTFGVILNAHILPILGGRDHGGRHPITI